MSKVTLPTIDSAEWQNMGIAGKLDIINQCLQPQEKASATKDTKGKTRARRKPAAW